jgi:hypothetical protein
MQIQQQTYLAVLESNSRLEVKVVLTVWRLSHQSGQQLKGRIYQSQKGGIKPGKLKLSDICFTEMEIIEMIGN